MKKTLLALSLAMTMPIFAQNADEQVLLTVGDSKVTCGEFERIYQKNNDNASFDSTSLNDYLKLFIDYKLKVVEAESLGLDTTESFKSELRGYRSQLEKPFFTDEHVDDSLFHEAYDHLQWCLRASHILIKCDEGTMPADTLKAYKRAVALRNRAVKGEDFATLARENSEDPSAAGNGGDLGYFSAFTMIYDFEKRAYETEVGTVSPVFRSQFGYHFIKVFDKKPNPGQVRVAQILIRVAPNADETVQKKASDKAKMVADSLKAGADWQTMLARYTDDKSSINIGGMLSWIGVGSTVAEFENAAFGLKNEGEISDPVHSQYGWHIIKLIGKKPVGTYENSLSTIRNRTSRDARSQMAGKSVLKRLKKEYNFSQDDKAFEELVNLVDTSIWSGNWNADKAKGYNKPIFTFADTVTFTQTDFAEIVASRGALRTHNTVESILKNDYERIVQSYVFNYERERLADKYPDFRYLLQEYHDGIILFSLTDEMVWSKAVADSAGLEQYYQAHKQENMWGPRVEVVALSYDKKAMLDANVTLDNANKTFLSAMKKSLKSGNFKDNISAAMAKMGVNDSILSASGSVKAYSKNDNAVVDSMQWKSGVQKIVDDGKRINIYFVSKTLEPAPKTLEECRGVMISGYQTVLETQWMEQLRAKYKVSVDENVLKSMIKD